MMITLSNRFVAVLAGLLALAGAAGPAGPAGPAGFAAVPHGQAGGSRAAAPAGVAVQQATGTAAQLTAVMYWSSARMTAALRGESEPPGAGAPAWRPRVLIRRIEHRLVHREQAAAPAAPWLSGDTGGRGLRWRHGGAVAAAVGKVFFTLGGAEYVCSGVLVGGAHPDVVLTAAHCVTGGASRGGGTQWAADWVFVPGYRDGRLPYGEYTARRFFVTRDWARTGGGSEQHDVAFVQVTAARPESAASGTARAGRAALTKRAQPPHGLPIAFASSQDASQAARAYVFGYPALAPYDGLYPDYCAGAVPAAAGGSLRTACGMTAGDSGGPWLAGFRPRSGTGTVVAVSTYKLSADPRLLYGAVLGPAARALYVRAAGSRR